MHGGSITAASEGVEIVEPPGLSAEKMRRVDAFVENVPTTFDELRDYRYDGARLGAGVTASLTYTTLHSSPDIVKYASLIRQYLRTAARAFEMTTELISRLQPPTIFTYNGRFAPCVAIAEAARLADVPVVYHETGATMDRYELFRDKPHALGTVQSEIARYWSAAGPNGAAVARDHFEKRRAGHTGEWLSFTEGQKRGALPPRRIGGHHIAFFTSSDYEAEYIDRARSGLFDDQRAAVRHIMAWVAARGDVTLTIREHPNSANVQAEDRSWLQVEGVRNVQVVPAESSVDTYALMQTADVVVTAGSTIGVEATFAGKPSIVVEPAYYSGRGCVYEPSSVSELDALLGNYALPPLARESTLPVGYYLAVYGIPFQHYTPLSLHTGRFCGTELVYSPRYLEILGITPFARRLWRRFKPAWIPLRRTHVDG